MQTDYNDQSAIPYLQGAIVDSAFHDIVTARAAADVGFGVGVIFTTTEGLVAVPSAAGQKFAGVVVHDHKGTPRATGIALHEDEDAFPVMRKGRIVVYSEQAVNPTAAVFLRHTTTTTERPGDFRTNIDTDKAIDVSTVARWVSTTLAAGLAVLEINMP